MKDVSVANLVAALETGVETDLIPAHLAEPVIEHLNKLVEDEEVYNSDIVVSFA